MKKSNKADNAGAKGIINRGKYTFEIVFPSETTLFPEVEITFAKYVHATIAE